MNLYGVRRITLRTCENAWIFILESTRCSALHARPHFETSKWRYSGISINYTNFIQSQFFQNDSNEITNQLIYDFRTFLSELLAYEKNPEDVGYCFIQWMEKLKELYADYCLNRDESNAIIGMSDAIKIFSVNFIYVFVVAKIFIFCIQKYILFKRRFERDLLQMEH